MVLPMVKRLLAIILSNLVVCPFVMAKPSLLNPKTEQAEDMRYYQGYHWDTSVERKALYDSIANGSYHMYMKMRTCMNEVTYLQGWLEAFNAGKQEVEFRESDFGMRDMDDDKVYHPDDGTNIATWLTRNFAETHSAGYTRRGLRQLQDKYWEHCLAELPVNLFTKEAQDKLDARIQREAERALGYP